MIDGLKLTMTGAELRTLIERRVEEHQARATRWTNEAERTLADESHTIQVPEHICRNEAARSEWRAQRLTFIRDHLNLSEDYRLGEMDLEFGELLPDEPELLGPEDLEDLEDLEPYARRICDNPEIVET